MGSCGLDVAPPALRRSGLSDCEDTQEEVSVAAGETAPHLESLLPPKCTYEMVSEINAFLVDLDGTIYNRNGLIPGAERFQDAAEKHGIAYAYLSNGPKGAECTARKLEKVRSVTTVLSDDWIAAHIWTAALAAAKYLVKQNRMKPTSVWVLGTTAACGDRFDSAFNVLMQEVEKCKQKGREEGANEKEWCYDWKVRMDLTLDDATKWANVALRGERSVNVLNALETVMHDKYGGTSEAQDYPHLVDPVRGLERRAYMDKVEVFNGVTRILLNGGSLVAAAPDMWEARVPLKEYPDINPNVPSVGALTQYFLYAADLARDKELMEKRFVSVGKGGNRGTEFMMDEGMRLLMSQDSKLTSKDTGDVAMIGDNYDTDILAAVVGGYKSIFVESGLHKREDVLKPQYAKAFPTCVVKDIGELVDILDKGPQT